MKTLLTTLVIITCILPSIAQTKEQRPDKAKEILVVDASCGQCKFGLAGKSCDLAVRVKGQAYFVDGTNIDSHGDAHADNGFCNAIRKAEVQGEIVDKRFKATYFKLLAANEKKEKSPSTN